MSQSSSPVELRALSSLYFDNVFRWRNNPEVYKWARQYEPMTHEEFYRWFHNRDEKSIKRYAICVNSKCVGVVSLSDIDWVNRRAEFSIFVDPSLKGCGYGKAGLRALLKHAFNVLNLDTVWGESFAGNPAIEMFKSIGFKEDGRRRAFYYRDGRYIDSFIVSILRSEYV